MDKPLRKRGVRAAKPPLEVTGSLTMPSGILPWERDLLAVILAADRVAEPGTTEVPTRRGPR